jgi:hypothetical protein
MRTIWEIECDINSCIDAETGEVVDFEKLNALQVERSAKIESVAIYIKRLVGEAALIREEENRLAKRRKQKERLAESYKRWLEQTLDGEMFETTKVAIGWRASERLIIERGTLELADHLEREGYERCIKYGGISIDKDEVTKLVKSGVEIPGVTLVQFNNLQLK